VIVKYCQDNGLRKLDLILMLIDKLEKGQF